MSLKASSAYVFNGKNFRSCPLGMEMHLEALGIWFTIEELKDDIEKIKQTLLEEFKIDRISYLNILIKIVDGNLRRTLTRKEKLKQAKSTAHFIIWQCIGK